MAGQTQVARSIQCPQGYNRNGFGQCPYLLPVGPGGRNSF